MEHGLQIGDPKKIGKNSNIFDSFTSKFLPLNKAKAFYFISANTVVSSIMTETLDLNYSQQLTSLIPDREKNTELIDFGIKKLHLGLKNIKIPLYIITITKHS